MHVLLIIKHALHVILSEQAAEDRMKFANQFWDYPQKMYLGKNILPIP